MVFWVMVSVFEVGGMLVLRFLSCKRLMLV